MREQKKGFLEFKDKTVFEGLSVGKDISTSGEVVFHTSMVGYVESLTDPSYKAQILVLTYPLVGNYGVPDKEHTLDVHPFFESENIQIAGLIMSNYAYEYSHYEAKTSLGKWMKDNNIPALTQVDTRLLTQYLRVNGAADGRIIIDSTPIDFENYDNLNLVSQVVTDKGKKQIGSGKRNILLVDCGSKNNIIRSLLKRDCTVHKVPYDYDFLAEDYDGILLSNGPGNPEKCGELAQRVKKSFEKNIPIFGICLGNQIMGMAAGYQITKLKYGHRSHNQPVIDLRTNRCHITSQNHSFALVDSQVEGWDVMFKNLNDNSCEGIRHTEKPFFSCQFHPEATGGPTDTDFLFDEFIQLVDLYRQTQTKEKE